MVEASGILKDGQELAGEGGERRRTSQIEKLHTGSHNEHKAVACEESSMDHMHLGALGRHVPGGMP